MSISQRDLANLAGVTQATVSLALRDDARVSKAVREQIQKLARRHDYQPNPALARVMAQTRRYDLRRSTLALFLGVTPTEFQETVPFHELARGVELRCEELGFHLDRFWVESGEVSSQRQAAIMTARGIQGAIILWNRRDPIPEHFAPIYENFACAVIGTRPIGPLLHVGMPDHFEIGNLAFEKARELGCERPAALIYPAHEATTDFRLSLGCVAAQRMLALRDPIPPLVQRYDHPAVLKWLTRYRPDFLLVTEEQAFSYFARFPELRKMKIYHWDSPGALKKRLPGIEQNGRMIGSAGVDLVVEQLHRNERGIPQVQKCVLIEGTPL